MHLDDPIDRRTILRWGGIGAATLALAACGSSTKHVAPPASTATTFRGPPPWSKLGSRLTGKLVRPGQPDFAQHAQLFDPRFDSITPQAIAYCASPTDVQRSLDFAQTYTVAFTARAGGHSYAGYSTINGLVIDVTPMNAVALAGTTATVGGGARLIDIYTALNARGVSIPGGSCPSVGIAGLALGGGIGVVGRKHGLTCDALTGVQLVTADGRVVTADASTNDDLFWACRGGGGGNFGIATSFEFATFAAPNLAVFTLRWPWNAASQVVPAWMQWIASAPDELWSNCILESPLDATTPPLLQVGGIWFGDQAGAQAQLNKVVAAVGSDPSSNFVETTPLSHAMYVEAGCAQLNQDQCHVVGQTPGATLRRAPSFAGSAFVDAPLNDAGVRAVVSGIDQRVQQQQPGAIAFDSYGGSINRVAADATAFAHRSSLACAQFSVSYDSAASAAAVSGYQQWLDGYRTTLDQYMGPGAYQNYIDPTQPNWQQAYYGSNLQRLEKVKKKWDPDDAFHFAQSVPSS